MVPKPAVGHRLVGLPVMHPLGVWPLLAGAGGHQDSGPSPVGWAMRPADAPPLPLSLGTSVLAGPSFTVAGGFLAGAAGRW